MTVIRLRVRMQSRGGYFYSVLLQATILGVSMSSPLSLSIAGLASADPVARGAAADGIYRQGRATAEQAIAAWWTDGELSALLLAPNTVVTVGLAVARETFNRIRIANGTPRLAEVPADQDAEEFELHFPEGLSLDVLTTREPGGDGAIARYLGKFGEGVQQVEFRCSHVDRASQILKENFGVAPIYPATRGGADGTRVNFFLVALPSKGKVLIELYELPGATAGSKSVQH
jgi:hypothetical protein